MTSPRRPKRGSVRAAASSEPLGLDAVKADETAAPDARVEDATVVAAAGPMIDPHGDAADVIRDVPEMSVEDVERRIGARTRARERRSAAAAPVAARIATNRRVILWRDSATILIFVVVALLAARFLLPSDAGIASATSQPTESPVAVGSLPNSTGLLFSAAPTIGGIVPPSLNLDATPTPIPVITLPPPTPTPSLTPAPSATPKPSHTPTPSHTPGPSKPPPTATPPPPPPIAGFTNPCPSSNPTTANTPLTFTNTSSGSISSYAWSFGDTGTDTSTNGQHTYTATGTYTVKLTVTGVGGTDSASALCYVNP